MIDFMKESVPRWKGFAGSFQNTPGNHKEHLPPIFFFHRHDFLNDFLTTQFSLSSFCHRKGSHCLKEKPSFVDFFTNRGEGCGVGCVSNLLCSKLLRSKLLRSKLLHLFYCCVGLFELSIQSNTL